MRFLITLLAVFLSYPGFGCTIARPIPEEVQGKSEKEIERAFLRRSFDLASVVFDAEVIAIDQRSSFEILRIRTEDIWKSDGKPIEFIYQERNILCGLNVLQKGGRYIVFGKRKAGLLLNTSSVPIFVFDNILVWPSSGISSGSTDVISEKIQDNRNYLNQLMVIGVSSIDEK